MSCPGQNKREAVTGPNRLVSHVVSRTEQVRTQVRIGMLAKMGPRYIHIYVSKRGRRSSAAGRINDEESLVRVEVLAISCPRQSKRMAVTGPNRRVGHVLSKTEQAGSSHWSE